MTTDEDMLKELRKISRVITISNGPTLETELAKYANTNERKIIWTLVDGRQKAEDIAKQIGKTKRAVDLFLELLEKAELIEERKYGVPPVRILDYVPSEWIQLIPKKTEESQLDNTDKQTENEQNE